MQIQIFHSYSRRTTLVNCERVDDINLSISVVLLMQLKLCAFHEVILLNCLDSIIVCNC